MVNQYSFDSEIEAIKALKSEGERLERIAIKIWRKYINSYTPNQYVRTGNAEKSIKLGGIKKLNDNTLAIELTFQNDLVYHNSRFKKGKKGHAVMLISDGWHSKKLEKKLGRRVNRFTYFGGSGYLYQVYKEFNATKKKGITLDIQWSGKVQK